MTRHSDPRRRAGPLVAAVLIISGTATSGAWAQVDQVTICHRPPGNPENTQTITVGAPALPAHLAHGDTLGPCPVAPTTTAVSPTTTATPTTIPGGGGGGEERKITICHIPPGNPQNPQTITVGISALPAHVAHGDTVGACSATTTTVVTTTVVIGTTTTTPLPTTTILGGGGSGGGGGGGTPAPAVVMQQPARVAQPEVVAQTAAPRAPVETAIAAPAVAQAAPEGLAYTGKETPKQLAFAGLCLGLGFGLLRLGREKRALA